MLYRVSMSCQVCGSLFPYSRESEANLATVLQEVRESCPYCGAQMSPQVAEVRKTKDVAPKSLPKPSQVAKRPASCAPFWGFRQVAGSAVGSRCRRWRYRDSDHSPTGLVLEAAFDSFNRAQVFAARWAGRLPRECRGTKVRRQGRFWLVPVPFARAQVGV